jgi:hypothetical protein
VRLILLLQVVLAIFVVGLIVVPLLDSTRECGDADALLANNLTSDAEKAYLAVLADEPDSECGRDGMQDVVVRRCAAADMLKGPPPPKKTAPDLTEAEAAHAEAKNAYVKLLATEPPGEPRFDRDRNAVVCARKGLKELEAFAPPEPTATPKPAVCRCRAVCRAPAAPPCRKKHKSWHD